MKEKHRTVCKSCEFHMNTARKSMSSLQSQILLFLTAECSSFTVQNDVCAATDTRKVVFTPAGGGNVVRSHLKSRFIEAGLSESAARTYSEGVKFSVKETSRDQQQTLESKDKSHIHRFKNFIRGRRRRCFFKGF